MSPAALDRETEGRIPPTNRDWPGMALIGIALWLIPSLGQLVRYLGVLGALAATCLAAICFLLGFARLAGAPESGAGARLGPAISAILFAVAFSALFPVARSGLLGAGSDRADALDAAIRAVLAGHAPYAALTYLGNPPTPLPGALILASPFHLIGASALQNLLWAPLFALFSPAMVGTRRVATAFVVSLLLLSPGAMQDFVTGGDYLVNALYVALALHWAMRANEGSRALSRLASGAFFALSLSSRAIYVIEVPILLAFTVQSGGARRGVERALWLALCLILINGPFLLGDPARFPLFLSESKIRYFPPWLHAGLALPAVSLTIAASAFFMRLTPGRAFGISALALAPLFLPILVWRLATEGPTPAVLMSAGFSLPLSVFGGLWLFGRLAKTKKAIVRISGT